MCAVRRFKAHSRHEVSLTSEEKLQFAELLKDYLTAELDIELGRFDAEFIIDHLAETMGKTFYNKGLADARVLLDKQMDEISDGLYGMEQSVDLRK